MPKISYVDGYLHDQQETASRYGLAVEKSNGGGYDLFRLSDRKHLLWGTLHDIEVWLEGAEYAKERKKDA